MNRMHADQIHTSIDLVKRLIASQFPEWSTLDVRKVESTGTSHDMYRLGAERAIRLPVQRGDPPADEIRKIHRWLPHLAHQLPVATPVPVALGDANEECPGIWSVCTWIRGSTLGIDTRFDQRAMGMRIGEFVNRLHELDASGGPTPGPHNSFRGVPLQERDEMTRRAIHEARDMVNAKRVTALWDEFLQCPAWHAEGVWIHGDIIPGNVLIDDGDVCGIIDWGGLGVGDPAVDMLPAWSIFDSDGRKVFKDAVDVDHATWVRGQATALSVGLVALPYYRDTNPHMMALGCRLINQAMEL